VLEPGRPTAGTAITVSRTILCGSLILDTGFGCGWPQRVRVAGDVAVRFSHPEAYMGLDDKLGNKAEEAAGKVKEGAGKATDDTSLEAEGKGDQAKSNVKQAGEKVKDAFN
jgi:uncharacterized protein YjbJ (UPF0337 family)